jgi:hypothetical protein
MEGPTTVGLAYGCVETQGREKFTTILPFTVTADKNEVLVILELEKSHDPVKFF